MKYFDLETVVNSYMGFQDCMTNKSWGYLALLKGCGNNVHPSLPYKVKLDDVSNFLENIFNLNPNKKEYNSERSLYVVFSNKWDKYFHDQGKCTPNIYDVAVWAYRRQSFPDDITKEEVLRMFAKEFNISLDIIEHSFKTISKAINFSNSLYSETSLKSALSRIGVDVSKENIDAKKGGVVASPGEISRGPFVQTLYAGLEITDYVIILQSEYSSLYGRNDVSSRLYDKKDIQQVNQTNTPLQQIFYGAPGTGKSFTIDKETNESNRIRTTFHPDYDYATFVGTYKPTVKKVDKYGLFGKDTVTMKHEDDTPIQEDVIVYKFIPQAFVKAYVEAWRLYADAECMDKDFYLVIEEINRGNCAQIFGDLFQLLDRTNAGFSSYAVETESDLQDFLSKDEKYKLDFELTEDIKNDNGRVIATAGNVMNGNVLVLPPNLHIWATMNTSDQSLFPIDSAFKRRWDWKYVPIRYDNSDWKVVLDDKEVCKWTDLQQTLNDMIYDATESEDKMLGDWFVKADGKNEINEEQLVGKIIFYLWNDVAKVDAGRLFDLEVEKNGRKRKVIFSDFYKIDGKVNPDIVREWLKNIKVLKNETSEETEQ